jgi:YD repeat-containing protein
MNMITNFKTLMGFILVVGSVCSSSASAVIINRVNGGMNAIYIDFSIPGAAVPLEVVRTYNSITAINEATGWPGAFGWGWTSPFESTLTLTAEKNVILRDGGSGNTIYFRPEKEDPSARASFFEAVKKAYFELKKGSTLSEEELKSLQLPEKMLVQLKTSAPFRAEMASKYGIKITVPKGEVLTSNEYGAQTLTFSHNQWVREKDGLVQVFDREGKLIQQVDKNNTVFNFIYSNTPKSQLLEVHDRDKTATLKFTWRQDRISEIIDNRNRKSKYTYDSNGNLTAVTDSAGQVFSYRYDNKKFPHLLTQIIYVSESHGGQLVTRDFKYDENGLVIYHKEKEGLEITYSYGRNSTDPENNFTTKVTQRGRTGTMEEMDEFFLKSRQDGSKYLYKQETKGSDGNVTTIFTPCCGKPAQVVKNGDTTNFKYYEDGLLADKMGSKENLHLEYDSRWKKPSKVVQNGLTSSFQYDSRGNLIKASNNRGEKVSLKYDRSGKIIEMLDGESQQLFFKYGPIGKPVLISAKGIGSVKINYDADGKILKTETNRLETSSRLPSQSSSQEITKRVMKSFQNLLNIIRPAGINNLNG